MLAMIAVIVFLGLQWPCLYTYKHHFYKGHFNAENMSNSKIINDLLMMEMAIFAASIGWMIFLPILVLVIVMVYPYKYSIKALRRYLNS